MGLAASQQEEKDTPQLGLCVDGLIYKEADDTGVSQVERNWKGQYRDPRMRG